MRFAHISRMYKFVRQFFFSKGAYAAYVSGWHGHYNLGDEAVYQALRHYFRDYRFVDIPRRLPDCFMNKISKMHFALLAGGTMISFDPAAALHIQKCFSKAPLAFVFGSGVQIPNPHSMDKMERTEAQRNLVAVLNRCAYVGVRGPESAEFLTSIGVQNVDVIGDPCLYFAGNALPEINSDAAISMGINLANMQNYFESGNFEIYEKEMVALAKLVSKEGWQINWYVVWPKDLAFTKKLAHLSGAKNNIFVSYEDVFAYLRHVRQNHIFLGTRLHAAALAAVSYVPTISLQYHSKCSDFMKSIGQEKFVEPLSDLSAQMLFERIKDILRHRTKICSALYENVQKLAAKQIAKSKELNDLVLAKKN